MTQIDYNKKIREVSREQVITSSMKDMPTGKVLYQTFENLFYLQHDVKHLFINKSTFAKYTEADEIYRKILISRWGKMEKTKWFTILNTQ